MKKTDVLKGVTSTGFAYEIAKSRLDNYELLEAVAEVEENAIAVTKVVLLLLGKEQKEKLMDHLRQEYGIVPVEAVTKEITEIMKEAPVKNS